MSVLSPRRLLWAVLGPALLCAFVVLAPATLGGATTWVSTTGTSMQPSIHNGDLVIVRKQSDYQVGEVVAYPSTTLGHAVVLHRIVAAEPAGFSTQGDNNDWLDPDQPTATDILGEQWLHVPGGGRMLAFFTNPLLIVLVVALVLTLGGGLVVGRRNRRGGARRAAHRTQSPPSASTVRGWAAGAGLAALALTAFSFGQPSTSVLTEPVETRHVATLRYAAPVDTAGVYDADTIRTGDPIFLDLASAIDTRLTYRTGFDPGRVTGTIRSSIRLSASNGWQREIPVGAPGRIEGPQVERALPVDFAALLDLVHTAEQKAGAGFGSYTAELVHRIHARGEVSGQLVTTDTTPTLRFALSDAQAVLQAAEDAAEAGGPVTLTDTTSTERTVTEPATASVLRWQIPIRGLRVAALGLGLCALVLAIVGLRGRRRPGAVFGARLVPAANVDLDGRSLVDVEDAAALAKLANTYEGVVLHLVRNDGHLFLLIAEETVYRYAEPTRTGRGIQTRRHQWVGPTAGRPGQPDAFPLALEAGVGGTPQGNGVRVPMH